MLTIAVEPNAKIGDTLLKEPALSAWAREHGERVNLWVPDYLRCFFTDHPDIELIRERPATYTTLHAWIAMEWACKRQAYFSQGYWHQVGLDDPKPWGRMRTHVSWAHRAEPDDYVIVAPFAESCSSKQGKPANIMPPLEWWRIVDRLDGHIISLGAKTDPRIPGTDNWRGVELDVVQYYLVRARAVISVETGILHMAAAVTDRVVFLSCATPPTLCAPPASGWKVVRANQPELFSHEEVLTAVREVGR